MIEIVAAELRLRAVQPEGVDAVRHVVFVAEIPHEHACFWIESIDVCTVALELERLARAALRPNQQVSVNHCVKVFAFAIDRRPDGYHHLDAQAVQFIDHRPRIWPIFFIKLPFTLPRPMEEVDDDLVNMNTEIMVFPRHRKYFILSPIAQFALPQAHAIFRKHGRPSCCVCIVFNDLLRRVGDRQPIVHVLRRFRNPFRVVVPERHAANGRIVPQKTVA